MNRKIIAVLLTAAAMNISLQAQNKLSGNWEGLLNIGAKKIKIILHIKEENNLFKTLLDSPEQGVVNLNISETLINSDSVNMSDAKAGIKISGMFRRENDSISAVFIQRGAKIPIIFGRSNIAEFKLNRPQNPKPPFPYKSEEIYFVNKKAGGIRLAGTLTLPSDKKMPAAVVLISGSGAQNRNEKSFDHEPFLVLSDFLSRNGIAVLRFDDRGVEKSEGNFSTSTSYDFSTDAEAAFEYLRTRDDIDKKNIGLIGHSEGGMIAPMIAARNNEVAFSISLAGPAVPIDKLMLKQIEELAKSEGRAPEDIQKLLNMNMEIFNEVKEIDDIYDLEKAVRASLIKYNYSNGNKSSQETYLKRTLSPWYRYFIRYNPASALETLNCPFLALNGTLDKQVDATMNLEAMKGALKKGNNQDFTVNYIKGLNHGFQEAKTGDVSEYRFIEQTISPIALDMIAKWINKRF